MLLRLNLVCREEGSGPVAYRNSLLRLPDLPDLAEQPSCGSPVERRFTSHSGPHHGVDIRQEIVLKEVQPGPIQRRTEGDTDYELS